jgi:hypothetical protein
VPALSRPSTARRLLAAAREPAVVGDAVQILKCVVAATAAWWLSIAVLHSDQPFLAPWTALLTVHATVYRSLARGVQTTVATVVGVGLSFLVGTFLGVEVWTFALAVLVGMLVSRLPWLRDEGIAVATTAIFVLGSGFGAQAPLLVDRLLEVGFGVAVGVLTNLLILPPLHDRQAALYVDAINRRMGGILVRIGEELEDSWDTDRADAWVAETVAADDQLDSAWRSVRFAHESARLNPRRRVPPARGRRGWREQHLEGGREVGYDEILGRIGEGISHLRHLARTLRESTYAESAWDDEFREGWAAVVRDAGHLIEDPDAEVEPVFDRLDALAQRFSGHDGRPPGDLWPVYGSLITSMRHIVAVVDDVASAREARDETRPNPTT